MQWSDIPFHPPTKTLRQFAGLCLLFFGAIAAWQGLVKGHATAAIVFGVLALTIGPLGLIRPDLVRPIFVGWMVLAFPIGWTVSRLVLALMFYGLFTPVALIFRLLGRDSLNRRRRPDLDTYWTPKPPAAGPRSYFKQF
jgi:hypothetical protein